MTTTTEAKQELLGWHFLSGKNMLLRSENEATAGKTVSVEGDIRYGNGVQASRKVADALFFLNFTKSGLVSRVRLRDDFVEFQHPHFTLARHLDVIAVFDADRILNEFSLWLAEQILNTPHEAGKEPDACLFALIEAKRNWLQDPAKEPELRAAQKTVATYLSKDAAQKEYNCALFAEVKLERVIAQTAGAAGKMVGWDAARHSLGVIQNGAGILNTPMLNTLRDAAEAWLDQAFITMVGEATTPTQNG